MTEISPPVSPAQFAFAAPYMKDSTQRMLSASDSIVPSFRMAIPDASTASVLPNAFGPMVRFSVSTCQRDMGNARGTIKHTQRLATAPLRACTQMQHHAHCTSDQKSVRVGRGTRHGTCASVRLEPVAASWGRYSNTAHPTPVNVCARYSVDADDTVKPATFAT